MGRINIYRDAKVQKFHRIKLQMYGRYQTLISSLGACEIYIPPSKKQEFWELMQIGYTDQASFYFGLHLREYYELMMKVQSLKEQIQMANFLLYHVSASWKVDIVVFFQTHINKAVEYAVEEDDVEQLKVYNHLELLETEKGFKERHKRYLVEHYHNKASAYLKNI